MMRSLALPVACLPLVLACGGGAADPGAGSGAARTAGGDEPSGGAFTWERAIADARAAEPSLLPTEVELELVDGRALVEVEGIRGDEVVERYYDPTTGALVREGVETLGAEAQAALPALRERLGAGEVRLEGALALARARYAAEVLREVELELHGDRLVLEVEIEEGGERRTLVHDATTGALLGEEPAEAHPE